MQRAASLAFIVALASAHAASGETVKPAAASPAAAQAASSLSQSKFIGLLYAEIARRTPPDNPAGPGEAMASFRVNAEGRVDKIDIVKSTSPAHAEIVRSALSKVVAPPPPGGVFEASQIFAFH